MKVLVFDWRVIGHHLEHLRHLARYAVRQSRYELHFAVHPEIEEHAPDLVELGKRREEVQLSPLTSEEYRAIEDSSTIRRALVAWDAASRRASAIAADHCVFMEVNFFQPVLGLPRARRVSFGISGTLFFPYTRIESGSDSWTDRIRSLAERRRKYLQIRWVLSNYKVKNIFVLNDPISADKLNNQHSTTRFKSLPDPVLEGEAESTEEDEGGEFTLSCGDNRTHFLLFGSLREQKGVRQVLEAAEQLHDEQAERVALHILGQSRSNLREDLPRLVAETRSSQPKLCIQYEDRFLPYHELETALTECDVVLAPYQRTEGSSGVLGHAAKHRCPVLGPSTGLVGDLIETYNLGLTIDASDPNAIASGIRRYLNANEEGETEGMRRYVEERTPENFSCVLLQTIDNSKKAPEHSMGSK